MGILYSWHTNDQYFATVVKNQYRQLPFFLHLRSQAIMMWIVLSAITLSAGLDARPKWILLAGFTIFSCAFPYLVKRGIIFKYSLRPTYGAETTFRMATHDVVITGPGAGRFPWTVYDRAVHFSDGILLVKRGGIRWLPDAALQEGTPDDAIAMVRNHLPVREIA